MLDNLFFLTKLLHGSFSKSTDILVFWSIIMLEILILKDGLDGLDHIYGCSWCINKYKHLFPLFKKTNISNERVERQILECGIF